MGEFSTSFCLTLLHSLWQSAIMLLFVASLNFISRPSPLARRNLLFRALLIQLLLSCFTLYLIYGSSGRHIEALGYSLLVSSNNVLVSISNWLFLSYLVVSTFKLFVYIKGWFVFKSSFSHKVKAPVELRLFTAEKSGLFGISRKVSLWISDSITSPLTYGFIKPVILLPVALMNQLSVREVEAIIIHELNHIKNNDYLLNIILVFIESIYFFNPFIRIMVKEIMIEREKDCDIRVLDFRYSSLLYADALVKVAKLRPSGNKLFMAAVSKNYQLLKRITFFTDSRNLVFAKKDYSFVMLPLVVFIFWMCSVMIYPYGNATPSTARKNSIELVEKKNTKVYQNSRFSSQPVVTAVSSATVTSVKGSIKKKNNPAKPTQVKDDIEIADNSAQAFENIAMHAASLEADNKKQIMIREENSDGQIVTKSYTITFSNGQWNAELVWAMKETRPVICDSIAPVLSDSSINLFRLLQ
jgi:bla regulator protein blaR1